MLRRCFKVDIVKADMKERRLAIELGDFHNIQQIFWDAERKWQVKGKIEVHAVDTGE